jgi:hypothetical protein
VVISKAIQKQPPLLMSRLEAIIFEAEDKELFLFLDGTL